MSADRSSETTYRQAKKFTANFQELLDEQKELGRPVIPELLCTVDETLLRATDDGKIEIEIIPKGESAGTLAANPSTVGSMTVFTNADGDVPYLYFCMKKKG